MSMYTIFFRRIGIFIFLMPFLGACGGGSGDSSTTAESWLSNVPAEYRPLYQELDDQLTQFDDQIRALGDDAAVPVTFCVELVTANANRGAELLTDSALPGNVLILERLKTLGVEGVAVTINFPMLYPEFHQTQAEYDAYLNFYRDLADAIRDQGFTLIVDSGAIFPQGIYTELNTTEFYKGLGWGEYVNGRSEVIRTVAEHLQPDYLNIGSEPDVEATSSGQPLINDPENYAAVVSYILNDLRDSGFEDIPVGAGVGTWHPFYDEFASNLAEITDLDFVDMHIYPINLDYLSRAITIAEIARANGKEVTLGEAWLYKTEDSELGFINDSEVFARDTFSFWEPLDEKFISVIVKLARRQEFTFASFFWNKYLFAYLEYDDVKDLSVPEIFRLSDEAMSDKVLANEFSDLALPFSQLIQ